MPCDATGEVTEDDSHTDASGNVVAHDVDGGTLTVQDVDGGENSFRPIAPDTAALVGDYGNFTFNAGTGEWTYSLVHERVDGLAAGELRYDRLTVQSADGTAQEITVTVHGANDAPVITAEDLSGSVTTPVRSPNSASPQTALAASYLTAGHNLINGLGGPASFGRKSSARQ